MGRKRKFGTHTIGGLNTKVVAHNLEEHELQDCANVSFDAVGGATPMRDHELLYTGSGQANQGCAAVVLNGQERLFWRSDAVNYVDANILSNGNSANPFFIGDGENVYIIDGENSVYDGTFIRDHGAPAAPIATSDVAAAATEPGLTISNFTKHASAPVITTLTDHGLVSGDFIYLRDLQDSTFAVLNDTKYEVTVTGLDTLTISEDTSGFTTFSSGVMQPVGPALSMAYRYAASSAIVLPDGTEIESSLVPLWSHPGGYEDDQAGVNLEATTLTGNQYAYIIGTLTGDIRTSYITPTTGVDYKIIFYRTKGDGDTYYVLREVLSADLTGYAYEFVDTTPDSDLGAAWLYDADSNDQPPLGTLACICQQQMFLAGVTGYETNLYKSRISGYDYFKPSDYVDVEARITSLVSMADRVVVFTAERIGTYSPIDEIGQFAWSLSPVGTTHSHSPCVTEQGVLFARDDGLWLFDGVTSRNLTEHITSEWEQITDNTNEIEVARTPDLVVCVGARGKLVASTLGGQWKWSPTTNDAVHSVCSSSDGLSFYGMLYGNLHTLFTGDQLSLSLTTKDYGGWHTWEGVQIDIDAYANGNDFTATVSTNHGESTVISFDGITRRNRYRAMLPYNIRGEYMSVKIDGIVSVYGIELVAQ